MEKQKIRGYSDLDSNEKQIMSLDYILKYIERNFSQYVVKSVTPFTFTIGSNNHSEPIEDNFQIDRSLFFGYLQICINPNDAPLEAEKIEIKYRSFLNTIPFFKTITRQVEQENLINESSESRELFDQLTISQSSTKYDFYVTFIGFKIDYN